MVSRKLLGVHVFQKLGEIDNQKELLEIQHLSALSWKRLYGRIYLYTNEEWLKEIEALGFDTVYDKIDTKALSTIPKEVNQKVYWAYGKLHISSLIDEDEFVLIDNDLWINEELNFDSTMSFMGYHYENFNQKDPSTPYVDFDNLIPSKYVGRWNKKLMATNCALLWINNKELKNQWLSIAKDIATNPDQVEIEDPSNVRKMIFIEQRLLPMISEEMNLPYSVFMTTPVYQAASLESFDGNVWDPKPENWTNEITERFLSIRHIWGGKKLWNDYPEVKAAQLNVVYEDLTRISKIENDGKSYTKS